MKENLLTSEHGPGKVINMLNRRKLYTRLAAICIAVFYLSVSALAQCPGTLSATYSTTAGSCNAQATITVTASGGTPIPGIDPYSYEITAGPVTRLPQSSSVFTALPTGTYTVKVNDQFCSVTQSVPVTNNYVEMNITEVNTPPTCPATNNDGTITVSVTGGAPPITYALTGPVTAGPQSSNVFTGLPAGTYTITITDQCGEVRSRSVTIAAAVTDLFYGEIASAFFFSENTDDILNNLGVVTAIPGNCDSVRTKLNMLIHNTVTGGYYLGNTTIRIYRVSDNALVHTETTTNAASDWIYFKKGEQYRIELDDNHCHVFSTNYIAQEKSYNFSIDYSCGSPSPSLSIYTNVSVPTIYTSYEIANGMTETFEIIVGPNMVGTTVSSGTMIGTFTGAIIPGGLYTIRISDGCETKDIPIFILPSASMNANTVANYPTCMDSTAAVSFNIFNVKNDVTSIVWTLTSGPASFTDGNGVVHNLTYPVSFTDPLTSTSHQFGIGNLPEGSYTASVTTYKGATACETYSFPFNVLHSDLIIRNVDFTATLGCAGASSITFGAAASSQNWDPNNTYYTLTQVNPAGGVVATAQMGTAPQTITNLSGVYQFTVSVPNSYGYQNLVPGGQCGTIFYDTTIDLTYYVPVATLSGTTCTDGTTSTVSVDNISGNGPFTYAIIAGPVTRPSQASPVFSGLPPGTYDVSITDACGSTVVKTIATSIINPVVTADVSPCPGANVTLTATGYAGAVYTWTGPNGYTATGSSAAINNYDPNTQSGAYTVSITLPGCAAVTKTISLANCFVLPIKLESFTGIATSKCTAILNWKTTLEQNSNYYLVEHSTDGIHFTNAAKLPAKNNENGASYAYEFTNLQNGYNYFRLKAVDINGASVTGNVVLIKSNCSNELSVQIAPNPAKDFIRVSGLEGKNTILVLDATGRQVTSIISTGITQLINVGSFARGTYFVKIIDADRSRVIKAIKIVLVP